MVRDSISGRAWDAADVHFKINIWPSSWTNTLNSAHTHSSLWDTNRDASAKFVAVTTTVRCKQTITLLT